jgi:tagatose-1,6-bisphosphate aldolase
MTLPAIQTDRHRLALLGLDVAPQLAAHLGLDLSIPDTEVLLKNLLEALAEQLAPAASGVVLDPVYSYDLQATQLSHTGLLFRLEKLQAETELAVPTLIPNWSISHIKEHYAWAKFELAYHPAEAQALEKKQLLAELADFCRHEGIGLFLKLMIKQPPETGEFTLAQFQIDQLTAVQELAKLSQVMALQYPQDALSCATITAELDQPWIVSLDGGTQYDEAKDQLRAALDNGAQGFLASEVLWPELYQLRAADGHSLDFSAMQQVIQTTIRDRFIELARITNESAVVL